MFFSVVVLLRYITLHKIDNHQSRYSDGLTKPKQYNLNINMQSQSSRHDGTFSWCETTKGNSHLWGEAMRHLGSDTAKPMLRLPTSSPSKRPPLLRRWKSCFNDTSSITDPPQNKIQLVEKIVTASHCDGQGGQHGEHRWESEEEGGIWRGIRRFASCHGPFGAAPLAKPFPLPAALCDLILHSLFILCSLAFLAFVDR